MHSCHWHSHPTRDVHLTLIQRERSPTEQKIQPPFVAWSSRTQSFRLRASSCITGGCLVCTCNEHTTQSLHWSKFIDKTSILGVAVVAGGDGCRRRVHRILIAPAHIAKNPPPVVSADFFSTSVCVLCTIVHCALLCAHSDIGTLAFTLGWTLLWRTETEQPTTSIFACVQCWCNIAYKLPFFKWVVHVGAVFVWVYNEKMTYFKTNTQTESQNRGSPALVQQQQTRRSILKPAQRYVAKDNGRTSEAENMNDARLRAAQRMDQ